MPINEHYDINEAFVELRLPIAHDVPGVYDLTADTGYRYSDYSTTGTTNTYKFEVQYAPIQDARAALFLRPRRTGAESDRALPRALLRTGERVSASIRAPAAPTATLVQCERTGVTPAQYAVNRCPSNSITQCVSGQCGQVIEGNSQLQPEVAKTWSLGLTFTPRAAGIQREHRLLPHPARKPDRQLSVRHHLQWLPQRDNPIYCNQIVRTPQGSLTGATVAGGGYFLQKDYNLGLSLVSGIDLQMNYRYALPAGWGTFSATLNGAYLLHDTITPFPGAGSFDCAGLFGSTCQNGSVNPHWRHNLRVTWDTPWKVLLSAQWRFIGPTTFDNNSTNPLLPGWRVSKPERHRAYYDQYNARIPGYSYLDLTAVWHALSNLELRAGVNNVLDKDPPIVPSADITGNSGPANSYRAYDYLGRQVFVAFTAKF